jgi:signal transduction histidine kinase
MMDDRSLKQQEKLATLGKLSAGLAHELNNPAAAAQRAARMLGEALPALHAETLRLAHLGLSEAQLAHLIAFQRQVLARPAAASLSALQQNTREDEIAAWLDRQGIREGWRMAGAFVSGGVVLDDLEALAERFSSEQIGDVIGWLHNTLETAGLLEEIEQSMSRITDLVASVKSYIHMDQGALQTVDIHQSLETTLTVMRHKLQDVEVVRDYDPDLPPIQARGNELSQVWTNLIDNAIGAMHGEGQLALITRREADAVTVEVADTGPGIPPEVMPHLFEPFFTTKQAGVGTGLGLDISQRIVQQHNGSIEVLSQPGNTRFVVRLPVRAAG